MYQPFHQRPGYLLTYLACWALAVVVLAAVSGFHFAGNYWYAAAVLGLLFTMRFDALLLAMIPALLMTPEPAHTLALTVVLLPLTWSGGVLAAVFIHNASHDQFRPSWLNRPLGELSCLWLRTNLLGWQVVHFYHHAHSDDPELDPHAPGGRGFWTYANGMQMRSVAYLDARHRQVHGRSAAYYRAVAAAGMLGFNLIPVAWMLVLGPTVFAAVWLPTLCSGWWLFTVINYYNHPRGANGANAPADLTHRSWHKLVNVVGFGILRHGTHHQRPDLFIPR